MSKRKKKSCRLFKPGRILATPGVLKKVPTAELTVALTRHLNGDWGDVTDEDRAANNCALRDKDRLLSVYHSAQDVTFWVITEWDRSATTILLPGEY